MPLINIRIENFKSIKRCDISTDNINLLIGANGTGKSNVLRSWHLWRYSTSYS